MEYQKTIKLLDNTLNQQTKFRNNSWEEINMTLVERIATIAKLNLKLQC